MSQTTHEQVGGGLDSASIEALVRLYGEPRWLSDLRAAAFETYQQTPMPTLQDEEWRRTDIRGLRLGEVTTHAARLTAVESVEALAPGVRAEIVGSDQTGGIVARQDTGEVFSSLASSFADRGVIFSDLNTAVREHGDLVQQYLGQGVPAAAGKFSALNAAFWTGGTFLYVPRRVEVTLPLHALNWLGSAGRSSIERTLIVVEPDAEVVLVDQWLGPNYEGQALAANVQEIFVGQGARVRYVTLQEWGRHLWNFSVNRTVLGRDATANTLVVAFGGRFHKANVESVLQGPGGSAEMLGLLFGDKNQFFDHHTLQDHAAPHTSSDLLYKDALTDRGRSVFSGLIHARKIAQKTDAIQTNRNLLLSGTSRADSIPNLEIEANDLRCTHAATISPVDDEQMFYLRARGLSETDAKRAIVEGFFEPVLERIPLPGVVEHLREVISSKIGA